MPKYIVDFTHADLGTVGKAEEHNYTEFEFTLNEDFQKCDFIIIEFSINGKKIPQNPISVSENQTEITFALPQQLTLPGNHHVQLVGFVVNKENSEPICIMKSDVIHFTIEQSISGTKQKADSNPSLLDTIISKIHKLMELAHFHHNKKTLDAITEELIELGTTPEIPLVYALPENPKAGDACRLIRSEITAADGGRAVVFDYANLKNLVEIGETHYNKVNYTINVNADEYSAWLRISVNYSHDEVKITVDKYNSLYDSYEGDYEQWENIFFLNNDSEWEFSTADNNAAFTPSYYYNSKTNTTTHLLEPLASVNIPDEYISSVTVEKDIDINIFDINIFHLEPIVMLHDGEWRAVANESKLYQQNGATISAHDIAEKSDGSKFFRLYLDWGNKTPLLTAKRWIDIPIEGTKEVTNEGSEPGIGTQSVGIQLQLGGGGSTKTIPIVTALPETAKEGDVVLYKPAANTFTQNDSGKNVYMDCSWIESYIGDYFMGQIYSETAEHGEVAFIVECNPETAITITYSAEEPAHNTLYGTLFWNFNADENRFVFDSINSVGNDINGEAVYFTEPPEKFILFDDIISEPTIEGIDSFPYTFFFVKPELYIFHSGAWKELYFIPTKTSELDADAFYDRIEDANATVLQPNKEYAFGEVATLTLDFAEGIAGKRNEYLFSFISGETATVLTLPSTVKWVNELTVEANKRYEISVVDDVALWCAVDMAVTE